MFSEWRKLKTTPPPFLYAFCRTTGRGLHVILAVKQSGDGFQAWSILDHGTAQKTIRMEFECRDLQTIVDGVLKLSDRYNEYGQPNDSKPSQFLYLDEAGEIRGPLSRAGLFDLLDCGRLSWDSQVWAMGLSGSTWESLDVAIGFQQRV